MKKKTKNSQGLQVLTLQRLPSLGMEMLLLLDFSLMVVFVSVKCWIIVVEVVTVGKVVNGYWD